jgi:hypothetical protein
MYTPLGPEKRVSISGQILWLPFLRRAQDKQGE